MALTAEQHTERRTRIGGYRHPIVVTDDLRERHAYHERTGK